MKIARILAASVGFVTIMLATYVIHSFFFRVDVVLYSALADVLLATVACTVLLWVLRWFRILGPVEKIQLATIWLLVGYAFAITVPTVLDRSLSFYILEKLDQRGGGIRQDAMAGVFTGEYMNEHRLVDVRLTEQLESGTIVVRNGCVLLTSKGRRLASFSRMFRRTFLPRHRLVMGQYSDALTDPFRNSSDEVSYRCH